MVVKNRRWRQILIVTIAIFEVGCGGSHTPDFEGRVRSVSAAEVTSISAMRNQGDWRSDSRLGLGAKGREIDEALENSADTVLGYRSTIHLSSDSWLLAELYSRRSGADVSEFLSVVTDPDNPNRQVIKLSSKEHTDGVILRSADPLPDEYRISFRIGHIQYGGSGPLNGYDVGDETAEPWMNISAVGHNGVYWATIVDTLPEPQSNIWSHHHRKFFIDAWNYRKRMLGVTVAAVDGKSDTSSRVGKSFIAHDGHQWKPRSVEPAFFYLPDRWYQVTVERSKGAFRYSVEGEFHGIGHYRFEDSLPIQKNCVYHYNRQPSEMDDDCATGEVLEGEGGLVEIWPRDSAYDDYFMMGDPHINFYEGSVLVDAFTLEAL